MKATIICLTVGLCLVASATIASECKPINIRIGPSVDLGPCTFQDIDFESCVEAPIRGTLKGTYSSYLATFGEFVPLDAPYASLAYGWALAVIDTNRGQIDAQEDWLINVNTITADVPFVSHLSITGGTDDYEGASGWIGVIAVDVGGEWRGWMRGEVCTP